MMPLMSCHAHVRERRMYGQVCRINTFKVKQREREREGGGGREGESVLSGGIPQNEKRPLPPTSYASRNVTAGRLHYVHTLHC